MASGRLNCHNFLFSFRRHLLRTFRILSQLQPAVISIHKPYYLGFPQPWAIKWPSRGPLKAQLRVKSGHHRSFSVYSDPTRMFDIRHPSPTIDYNTYFHANLIEIHSDSVRAMNDVDHHVLADIPITIQILASIVSKK